MGGIVTDRYSEPEDESVPIDDEPEDDSHLSRLTPFARRCLDEARQSLAREGRR